MDRKNSPPLRRWGTFWEKLDMGYYFEFSEVSDIYKALCSGREAAYRDGDDDTGDAIEKARMRFTDTVIEQMAFADGDLDRRKIFEKLHLVKHYLSDTVEQFICEHSNEMLDSVRGITKTALELEDELAKKAGQD